MNPPCAKCTKAVYPVEALKCLDQVWHKHCFKCDVCGMTLNMKNYKGYDKKPYCSAHYPTTKFTSVTDTPENIRLKQQSQIQSQVEYHKEFETKKGTKISTAIDPETERLMKNSQISSQAAYHGVREQRQQEERRRSEIDYDQDEFTVGIQSKTSAPPPAAAPPQKRAPGKISDYDPMAAPQTKDNTPYSARGQARVVYNSSEDSEFGTLIGFQKVPGAQPIADDPDPVEVRRKGSGDHQRTVSERSSASSSRYEPPPPPADEAPVFVPYVPEPREETPVKKQPEVKKFRLNTGFEKLKTEPRAEQNGKVEGNNNRLSVDDKYTDNFNPPAAQQFQPPDPYAPMQDVMPTTMPPSPSRHSRGHSPPPPPPLEEGPNSYEVQVEVKYQPSDSNHQNHSGYPQNPDYQGYGGPAEPRDRGYSSPAPYDHYNQQTQRSYEDYDRYGGPGAQTNPAQMNYSQTLPRGDSRGHYHQDFNRYDPRDPRMDPRDPRYDPRMDPRYDPRADPTVDPRYDPRMDPRYDPRIDPRMDPRYDPRDSPRSQDGRYDPRMDARYQQQQQQSPRGYSTLPNRKGRAGPDPYGDDQYQAPRRMEYGEPPPQSPAPRGPTGPVPRPDLARTGEHGSQASLGSLDSGGSGTMRRQRKPRQPFYRALYDYQAADDDEVSFNEGDAIIDVVPIDQGWMEGRVKRTGEYGMLPANYVEYVQ